MLDVALRAALTKAVSTGAVMIHKDAVVLVQQGPKTGAVYTRGAVSHQASAPGEAPASDTGELASSMTFALDPDGLGAAVIAKAPYAKFLEFGTERMLARPFMVPAFEKNRAAIQELLRAAYDSAKG